MGHISESSWNNFRVVQNREKIEHNNLIPIEGTTYTSTSHNTAATQLLCHLVMSHI